MKAKLRERAIICRMVLEIIYAVHEGLAKLTGEVYTLTRTLDAIFVLSVVIVEHDRGHGATVSAISKSLGMPHPTVLRKLAQLQEIGIIERRGNIYCIVRYVLNQGGLERAKGEIKRAARELSKMDI